MKDCDFRPGDLVCLKKYYHGLGHPDDFVVGVVISACGKFQVLFTERNGACSFEDVRKVEASVYYRRLNRKFS